MTESYQRRFCIHGLPITIDLSSPFLQPKIDAVLRPFIVEKINSPIPVAHGSIQSFNSTQVLRNVNPQATRVGSIDNRAEIYSLGEQYWLIDERWGICWLNLLKRQWRSWMLPKPTLPTNQCIDAAVLWPMAQLLKIRGLHLIPAISIRRDQWSALILSPYPLDREIIRLASAGFTIVGPRYSALREKQSRVELLDFPHESANHTATSPSSPTDCQAVFLIESARRLVTRGKILTNPDAAAARIRHALPFMEVPPTRRRLGDFAAHLARQCRCVSVELSKNEEDFHQLIESSRRRWSDAHKIQITIGSAARNKPLTTHPTPRSLAASPYSSSTR
jgi:hypothetical protein